MKPTRQPVEQRSDLYRSQVGLARGQLLMSVTSLLVAGVLLARGFIGVVPGRPLYLVAGGLLILSSLAGLTVDHVRVVRGRGDPGRLLAEEVDRCRRYGRRLALVQLEVPRPLGLELVASLRSTDRAWWEGSRLCVLLIETDHLEAQGFVARLAPLVANRPVALSCFPDDAITVDGLRRTLELQPVERVASEGGFAPGAPVTPAAPGGEGDRRRQDLSGAQPLATEEATPFGPVP